MLDADTRRDIEELKRQLKYFEDQEASLLNELETVRARKMEVKDKLKVLSDDEKYQQDMLAMVYQQRHGKPTTNPDELNM
jgi:prefoldin subunit 5